MRVSLIPIAAAVGSLLLLAGSSSAAPGPDTSPVRLWSVTKVVQGAGELPVANGGQVGGDLSERAATGRVVFNLPLHAPYWYTLPRDRAFGAVASSADGKHYSVLAIAPPPNPRRVGAAKGSIAHLDEYQAYVKQADDATLRITVSDLLLQTVDDNNSLAAWECPSGASCEPVRTVIRFHARAYAASAGGDFFDAGGVAYLEGHQHSWRPGAATSADSPGPLWGEAQFDVDGDTDDSGTGAAGAMYLNGPRTLTVPLGSVRPGELFAVHVSLEAEAVDDRGGESGAQAFVQDPQHLDTALLRTHGLEPRGKPTFDEPPLAALTPAQCPTGTPPHAGVVQLSAQAFTVDESERGPMVLVTRSGGSQGSASVTVAARGGTAQAGRDFTPTTTIVRFAAGDSSPRLVEIPIREDRQVEPAESFTVALSHARCGTLGGRRRATVTIVDDDQVPTPPPAPFLPPALPAPSTPGAPAPVATPGESPAPAASPTPAGFTIAGTVDGLQGTGLVLTDLGGDLLVTANGPFTFPGTRAAGQGYEVAVRTQPHGPDQVCTVQHGTGTVGGADVTDVIVHCELLAVPSGLDRTFGSDGRVSTPVGGGHGEAVVIQPSGDIVTAGWRTAAGGNDFALTRHDTSGALDQSFGVKGIVTTDLGGADDEAFDAAPFADGGLVVVGRTDAAGATRTAFGVVRYRPDGTPDPGFGTGGIVKLGFFGKGAGANAVAVQPDGKIVVAGFALDATGINGDLALARLDPDGTLDPGFGTGGLVTTNLGTEGDDVRAVVVQPDGRIVVAGSADEDIAFARYLPDGTLDASFGHGGSTITDLGSDDVANGVALTPDGSILIAGYTLGPGINRDFLLARYRADGGLDATFGDHGTVKTDVSGGDDFAENLTVDGQGRIVLVGRATSPTILDMALVRYRPDGTLDTSFDGDGILTVDFHGRGEFGQDVALDGDGRIVAAGYTANGSDTEFALMRASP
jgi:uncharacterized delta-60 repeat protein